MQKISLITNTEIENAEMISAMVNGEAADRTLRNIIDTKDIKLNLVDNLNNLGLFDVQYASALARGDYTYCLTLAITEGYDNTYKSLFDGAYDFIHSAVVDNIATTTDFDHLDNLCVVSMYDGTTLDEFNYDLKIAWIPPANYDHLMEHESLDLATATLFCDKYNDMLRAASNEFDYFFDGDDITTVAEFIRQL